MSGPMNEPQALKAYREKYWDESSVEEKLDALRDEVERIALRMHHLVRSLDRLLSHTHDERGMPCVPLAGIERNEYCGHELRAPLRRIPKP